MIDSLALKYGMTQCGMLRTGFTTGRTVKRFYWSGTSAARAALAAAIAVTIIPITAVADPWQVFSDRCLDAFEAFSPAVVNDLPEIKMAALPQVFSSDAVAFGPTKTGEIVVVDAAPIQDGDRTCTVLEGGVDVHPAAEWIEIQTKSERYEVLYQGQTIVLLSGEWIEPRVQVSLTLAGPQAGTYSVMETYLES